MVISATMLSFMGLPSTWICKGVVCRIYANRLITLCYAITTQRITAPPAQQRDVPLVRSLNVVLVMLSAQQVVEDVLVESPAPEPLELMQLTADLSFFIPWISPDLKLQAYALTQLYVLVLSKSGVLSTQHMIIAGTVPSPCVIVL